MGYINHISGEPLWCAKFRRLIKAACPEVTHVIIKAIRKDKHTIMGYYVTVHGKRRQLLSNREIPPELPDNLIHYITLITNFITQARLLAAT